MAIEITEVKRRFRYNGVTLPDVAGSEQPAGA